MLKLLIVLMLKESEHQVVKNLIFPRGSGIDYGEKCHENLVRVYNMYFVEEQNLVFSRKWQNIFKN